MCGIVIASNPNPKNIECLKVRARYRTNLVVYISNIKKDQKWQYGP
jgi:hypothetical protein